MSLPRYTLLRLVLCAGALALPAPVAAQQPAAPPARPPAQDSTARRIEPMTVRGSRAPSVTGGATAVTIRVDSLPVPLLPAPTVADVLRQTAFVLVRQNSRGESELGIRGSDSRQAAVMLDGLPLTVGWDSRTDPSLIPSTGVQQITVIRGLGSLLAGANTLGGVIRLDLNGPATASRTLNVGVGFDQFSSRVLSASGGLPATVAGGTLTVRAGISNRQRDGFALPGGTPGSGIAGGTVDPGDPDNNSLRTNSDLEQTDGFAAVRYDHLSGAYVGVTGTAYTAERGVAPEQHIRAPRFWRYPQQQRTLGILSAGTGRRSTPFGRGSVDVSAGQTTQALEIETFTNRTFSTVATRETGRERTSIMRLQGTHSLPRNAQLRVGGTMSMVGYDETLDAQRSTARAVRYEQVLQSIGTEVEVPVWGRALLSGGLVRDEASTPKTGGRAALGTLARSGWRVGSTLMATDGVRLHVSVSERARFAALRELYSGAIDRFDPNPDLRPETLLAMETGITLDGGLFAQRGLQVQATAFAHRLDDAVVRTTLPNRLFRRINRDAIRSAGVELLTTWTPAALRGASVTADATLQRIRLYDRTITTNANNERRAEHNPERRANLALLSPEIAGFRVSAMARHIGVQYCQHPDLGRLVALGAQTTADAAVTRRVTLRRRGLFQRLSALVALDNLGNRTVYDQCGLPQAGRTLRVGVTLG